MTENPIISDARSDMDDADSRSDRHIDRIKTGRIRRRITPWKKTALWFCLFFLILAGALHLFRVWRSSGFEDQNEAARWGSDAAYAQVSAFLPSDNAMKQEDIMQLEYEINTALAQDSIKVTSENEGARLWQDCYAGMGSLTLFAEGKTADVEAVGTGGEFFMFHPLILSTGSYYSSSSVMKDEIILDQQTAWKLFGAFDIVGRTVRVGDTNLRIAGVFKKEEGKIYEEAGMPDCLVFVQYRTLVKYDTGSAAGDGDDAEGSSSDVSTQGRLNTPGTTTSPADQHHTAHTAAAGQCGTVHTAAEGQYSTVYTAVAGQYRTVSAKKLLLAAAQEGSAADESADMPDDADAAGVSSGSEEGFDADDAGAESGTSSGAEYGSGSSDTSGSGSAGAAGGTQSTAGAGVTSQSIGTGNTAYKDKGRITIYEIVMPDPVDGYAANKLRQALGEDTPSIVVDNTNRFGYASLWRDLRDFALAGMRTHEIRLPYWENAARGYEAIFALLFLLECILIGATVLLLVWMIIHYIRHKTWTLLGNLRAVESSIYERQSRKRYPEYYEERDSEASGDDEKGGSTK